MPAPEGTMKAVVFRGVQDVQLENRPIPKIIEPTDAICKVIYTALCGSELHVFRGHQPSPTGFIMGHEFVGEIVELGAEVKGFRIGERVVTPFTSNCGDCFYCLQGYTSRCQKGRLFGCEALDGAQAEYVRVPLAGGTMVKVPAGVKGELVVLMADIFPTGYFCATSALRLLQPPVPSIQPPPPTHLLLLGCGPVGLCALASILELTPATTKIIIVDSVPSRLDLAASFSPERIIPVNFLAPLPASSPHTSWADHIRALTPSARGVDAAMELVGHPSALKTAIDCLRPFGALASVGVHQNVALPFTGADAYAKNLRAQFGRCPVRAVFDDALVVMERVQGKLGWAAEKVMDLTEAKEGYGLFDRMEVQKVVFRC